MAGPLPSTFPKPPPPPPPKVRRVNDDGTATKATLDYEAALYAWFQALRQALL